MMLTWGLEVQSFDLSQEQSSASFALLQRLSATKPPPRPEPISGVIRPQYGTDFAEQSPYDEATIRRVQGKKILSDRGSVPERLNGRKKMCKALERYLRGMQEVPDDGYGPAHPALEMQVQLGSELAEDI